MPDKNEIASKKLKSALERKKKAGQNEQEPGQDEQNVLLPTEFEFTLPMGYADENGELHKIGVMRLATAADEVLPLRDPRVQQNPAYLTVILLSRVVTKLGSVPQVNPGVIEKLYTADFSFLQSFYELINGDGTNTAEKLVIKAKTGPRITLDSTPGNENVSISDEAGNAITLNSAQNTISLNCLGELSIKAGMITIAAESTAEFRAGATTTVNGALVQIQGPTFVNGQPNLTEDDIYRMLPKK